MNYSFFKIERGTVIFVTQVEQNLNFSKNSNLKISMNFCR